ncbi:hypothetical protein E1263_07345 [Kribbella antibiotica]|uniref:Uncharacterized protein n=1 Tax=Kribbella antibiotica TaxID=190195 RepID=A0A4R4ZR82_9ACTN|nr:hypothetical protein [Kribbella antibiotica]TDD61508.1 hypothetical protein E1263_07345 [Kribbella antibiotica]
MQRDGELGRSITGIEVLVRHPTAVAEDRAPVPVSFQSSRSRTGPLNHVAPSTVVLATRAGDDRTLVEEFRRCATEQLAGPPSGAR